MWTFFSMHIFCGEALQRVYVCVLTISRRIWFHKIVECARLDGSVTLIQLCRLTPWRARRKDGCRAEVAEHHRRIPHCSSVLEVAQLQIKRFCSLTTWWLFHFTSDVLQYTAKNSVDAQTSYIVCSLKETSWSRSLNDPSIAFRYWWWLLLTLCYDLNVCCRAPVHRTGSEGHHFGQQDTIFPRTERRGAAVAASNPL